VKWIIIGQDPTVRNLKTRENIKTVLMLDQSGNLRSYISKILENMEINFDEIYVTNLFKNFFKDPPADDPNILNRHFRYWIDLLRFEISNFPMADILTLGEPVINQLCSKSKNVKEYWGYTGNSKSTKMFDKSPAEDNYLNRSLYVLPHQTTYMQNSFYKKYFDDYCKWIIDDKWASLIPF
jgi:hypothetical protein